jgi:transposase
MRRVFLRGHTNIRKRLLIHVGGFNLGLLMRQIDGRLVSRFARVLLASLMFRLRSSGNWL